MPCSCPSFVTNVTLIDNCNASSIIGATAGARPAAGSVSAPRIKGGDGMKNWLIGTAAAVSAGLVSGGAWALDIAWVHSNAAAQSEQRVKAGIEAWLQETGKSDWNITFLDSGGSGEQTASNLQDAASRGVDAIIITMADLRASRAALDAAIAAD